MLRSSDFDKAAQPACDSRRQHIAPCVSAGYRSNKVVKPARAGDRDRGGAWCAEKSKRREQLPLPPARAGSRCFCCARPRADARG